MKVRSLNDKYFMQLNGKHKFYTPQELKTAGIKVDNKNEIHSGSN